MTAAVPSPNRPIRTRRRPRVVAAMVACVVGMVALLAGCNSSNVVVYIDGAPALTVEQLQRVEEPLLAELGEQGNRESVITLVILGKVAPRIAEKHGIELPAEQEAKVVEAAAGIEQPEARAIAEDYLRAYLVMQTIGQQNPAAWGTALGQADVEVNPRYGTWSAQQNTWVVTPGGSLSVPEGAGAAAGQQQGG